MGGKLEDLGAKGASFKMCSLIAYLVLYIWQTMCLCSQGALDRVGEREGNRQVWHAEEMEGEGP